MDWWEEGRKTESKIILCFPLFSSDSMRYFAFCGSGEKKKTQMNTNINEYFTHRNQWNRIKNDKTRIFNVGTHGIEAQKIKAW